PSFPTRRSSDLMPGVPRSGEDDPQQRPSLRALPAVAAQGLQPMTDKRAGTPPALDFSTVIASTVHDMKNSLGQLMQTHNRWLAQLPAELAEGPERGVIEYEFSRLNGMLVQLLGLYKLGVNQLPLKPAYHEVEDFIQAQLARHDEVLAARGINGSYEVEEFDLM